MNKRFISLLLVFVIFLIAVACNNNTQTSPDPSAEAQPTVDVLATTTPVPNKMQPVTNDVNNNVVEKVTNILPEEKTNFNNLTNVEDSGWAKYASGKVELSPDGVDGTQCVKFSEGKTAWSSPAINLASVIKEAGRYYISFSVKVGGEDVDTISGAAFDMLIRGNGAKDANSFITKSPNNDNYRYAPSATIDGDIEDWMTVELTLEVQPEDIDGESHGWHLCMHMINEAVTEFYVDDVVIGKVVRESAPETQKLITETETWIANEMTFIAQTDIKDPVASAKFDVIFKKDKSEMTVPGFWDGENIWRVRFALPAEGTWSFTTVFSDTSDSGLHNISGTINVKKYSGDLEIYKHGFIKVDPNKKYFVYNDGTPFFYLGDTHWNFLTEEYDKAGSNAGDIDTTSHFKYIVNKRVSQGYTVYQTQPNAAGFDLTNGITQTDISGFRNADKYFKYIADMGLVHANAQFFFASTMNETIMQMENYNDYLDMLSRYWVARFSAYPVMWTLAQEVDNDYYYNENTKANTTMNSENNPWKHVCECLYKYDPHKNPISAHQEGASTIINYTTPSNSAFRDVKGHSWWANLWKPKLNQALDFSAPRDYWASGQNKPIVVYEGRYDLLWTNAYGARAQGWLAFLNGMYGHGYGAVDIWLYKSNYDIENDTVRDGITITTKDKATKWGTSIELPAGYQLGYMKEFLEKYEWWNLVPVFDDKSVFESETGTYSFAKIENDLYIGYLFDDISKEGTLLTGTLKGLDENADYTYYWYNPRTNVSGSKTKIEKGSQFVIGEKPSAKDWVIVVEKVK